MVERRTDSSEVPLRRRESGAGRLLRTLRERWLIIVIAVVAAVAAALIYVAATTPTYKAEADLLVSPETDPNLTALSLFRSSGDPTRDIQTATLLVDTPDAAAAAAQSLKLHDSPEAVLQRVQVAPVAGSDVVAVTASASTPGGAQRLANAFAQGAVFVLSRRLQEQLQTEIPRLQAQVAQLPLSRTANGIDSLTSQLGALRALVGAPDPTIQLERAARAPRKPAAPRKALSVAAGGILGLVLGVIVALGIDALDPRLRREAQLRDVIDLPVLARLPAMANGQGRRSGAPNGEKSALLIAHEFLVEALGGFEDTWADRSRTIVFTPADRSATCTAIAAQHAWLVASSGQRVTLIDGDPRNPGVGPATGAEPSPQVTRVLEGSDQLQDGLVAVESGGIEIRVLALAPRLPAVTVRMPRGREMIAQLLPDTDVLVIDAPRLTDSVPALLLARSADWVVFVAQIGETRLDELREVGELFANHGLLAAGIVLVGAPAGRRAGQWVRRWRRPLAPNAPPATGSGSPRAETARPTPPAPSR